jgi:hypothetical protein
MYEMIEIATKESKGLFATYADAVRWADAHGGRALYLITPW